MMLCLRDVLDRLAGEIATQVHLLIALTEEHRDTMAVARTLTQAALPTTLAVKTAAWLSGVLDAAQQLAAVRAALPVQFGGAVGTLAAVVELSGSIDGAVALHETLSAALGLVPAPCWQTTRAPMTRVGDLLVGCCDAWGHIAADVATGCRTEIGEFAEGHRGGSSTMPHKNNPVKSVLIRGTALTAPALAATLHSAAAATVDERADGAWHAEWATLRTLARRTVTAAAHTCALLAGLHVDAARMAANLANSGDLGAEQRMMAELTGRPPAPTYLGAAHHLVDAVLDRARRYHKEMS
nr:lyase family protein [Mycolicibacterium septicum]